MDIKEIPTSELFADLRACKKDFRMCEVALHFGLEQVEGCTPTHERLEGNKKMIEIIEAELERRKS